MATRGKLRRIEKVMQGHMGAIELVDGSTFYFDPEAVVEEMFAFFSDSLRAVYQQEKRPDPPPFIYAVANARDREKAYRAVFPEGPAFMILDEEALLRRGEVKPRRISTNEEL